MEWKWYELMLFCWLFVSLTSNNQWFVVFLISYSFFLCWGGGGEWGVGGGGGGGGEETEALLQFCYCFVLFSVQIVYHGERLYIVNWCELG